MERQLALRIERNYDDADRDGCMHTATLPAPFRGDGAELASLQSSVACSAALGGTGDASETTGCRLIAGFWAQVERGCRHQAIYHAYSRYLKATKPGILVEDSSKTATGHSSVASWS